MSFLLRGLYTAASGMIMNNQQSEAIDRNLENMNNPGYLEESERVTSFPRLLVSRLTPSTTSDKPSENVPLGIMGTGVYAEKVLYSTEPGLIRETGNMTDVALNGDGFFAVETLDGERYTRNGHFQVDPSGMLRTAGGNLVLGQNGAIGPLPDDFTILQDGTIISTESSQVIDRLTIVDIPAEDLDRDGLTSLYNSQNQPTEILPKNIRVEQGFIEESNVDLNAQMVKMIQVTRSYSANQKVVQTNDEILQKAVNEIGKV
ncbi:Flagellar basal-body rod protein FlgF [Dehalobacter sp. UNSWDHB]|uniref:flagellar hook-basal body protein n=1 Tax=unclassified Dehalobacter TaxID=2635733 RepID=UPI00028B21E7|nr:MULTISPECIES: flagellar hook-basal body protein [unclassified Dehalobacter]AFV02535.1 Flagellar basal-body rod protein FlgF [Dehalobacter sp. DCA]AFV05524.1 Flagellar basal-body rod protein FlgF [Dehalobacter sp. CF]EQB21787.1 Flagellar basal-body rod protein FlgF [Dehalobacter sp. UNSWDHB]